MIRKLIGIILLAVILYGCGVYSAFEEKFNPPPQIQSNAGFDILTDGQDYYTRLRISTSYTDHTQWKYFCRDVDIYKFIGASHRDSTLIATVYPSKTGGIQHTRKITCFSDMIIHVTAIKNFNKKSQKSSSMEWEINIPQKLSEAGAGKVNY